MTGIWLGFSVGAPEQYFIFRKVGDKIRSIVCGSCDNPYTMAALDDFEIQGGLRPAPAASARFHAPAQSPLTPYFSRTRPKRACFARIRLRGDIHSMGILPYGDDDRLLSGKEEALVKKVYRSTHLPPFSRIRIRNGGDGRAVTWPNHKEGTYNISVGQKLFDIDLTDYESDTLVHEMTHVWQYYHSLLTEAHGLMAHVHRTVAGKLSKGYRGDDFLYEYNILTDSWNDMGFEGQAQLVEEWYRDGMKGEDDDKRFCFVKKVLYDGSASARSLNIIELCEKDFNPPPSPDPQPVRITMKDDSFVIILNGDVMFDFDKSDVKPAAFALLGKAAKNIKALWRDGTLIHINGYTDDIGKDEYNNRLSERRAKSVANWLLLQGLPNSVMTTSGFGKANPMVPNSDAKARAKNRRVEIFLTRR